MLFCVVLAFSCGRANRPATEQTEATHVHADGQECTHDHGAESAGDDEHEGHDHGAESAGHEGDSHGAEAPEEIIFPSAQAARIDFKVETVTASPFSEVIRTSGRVMPAQGQEVMLAAPVGGIVSFAGANLAEGNSVGNSQTLFHISSKNVATGDFAAKSAAAYHKAKADYERAQALLADRIVSQREFDAITAQYMQAKAEYDAIAAAQSARGTGVASPIAGYVTMLAVKEGDFVEMGQTLAAVSQNRRLTLRAEVSQRYYAQLRNIRSANFTVPYDNSVHRLADMGGRLISVGQAASSSASLIPVTFEFDNNGSVIPGAYVEVYLLGAPVADALTLPMTAITEQQGLYYVYVQLDEEGYERRQVTLGGSDGERVRIVSGLRSGERVVTRGAINVKLSAASGAIPHGHAH